MPEIDLDNMPKTLRVDDLIALLGEAEAKRLVAGIKARKAMPVVTLDQLLTIRRWLDGHELAKADESLIAQGLRAYFGNSGRRLAALRAWLEDSEAAAASSDGLATIRPTRRRRPITDPEVLARRNAALTKARAARAEKLATAAR